MSITYRDKYTFLRLYKVYVRRHLQYCSSAWSPYSVADKELLESVQKRAVTSWAEQGHTRVLLEIFL